MNLTSKQEAFAVEYILNGGNATQAYYEVYNVKKDAHKGQVWTNAHKVLHNDKVSTRIKELRQSSYEKGEMSIEERKKLLATLARGGDIKAVDILNKMDGAYIEKVEIKEDLEITFKRL